MRERLGWRRQLARVGPGLVTGASDDDPSGIGTYSQVGAQFGFGMLWTTLFSLPLMMAVQEASALIGRVTGHGLASSMRRYSRQWVVNAIVVALVVANFVNIGADLGAMGSAMALVVGGHAILWVALLGAASLVAEVLIPYRKYASVLKWLTLSLLAYVAAAFAVHLDWGRALLSTARPRISLDKDTLTAFVAVLGTTISPYLFFWQASQEVEEIHRIPARKPLKRAPEQAADKTRIKVDTYAGMLVSNLVAWFIIAVTGATLFASGVHDITSATEAARALGPVAGRFAGATFALGIVATGLLAVPVLAGSAAYGVAEARRWRRASLEDTALRAPRFYGVIGVGIVLGAAMNLLPINPMQALFWTAVLNGVVAVPLLVIILRMAGSERVMGRSPVGLGIRALGWIAVGVMGLAAIGMVWAAFL